MKLYQTEATARAVNVTVMMELAAECFCTEAMAERLLRDVRLVPHWWTCADKRLLEALASNPKLVDRLRKVAAELAERPAPLHTKRTLLRLARARALPEIEPAIRRWARSDLHELAIEAQATLKQLRR